MTELPFLKGRGAQINPSNPFHNFVEESQLLFDEEEWERLSTTKYIDVHPKSILNKVTSPDIGMAYSMNPYQGCEHGCVYCYARNTHTFWGYSAGIEFEQKVLVKQDVVRLLEKQLQKKSWEAVPIMLSGNTDCYQPAEKKFEITREILKTLLKYRHPVGIITKNSLVLRDMDIIKELNEHDLVHVSISITTLNEDLRRLLEPRTATIANRLKAVKQLSDIGVPVNVMMAPLIPGLNDHEIMGMAHKVSDLGAQSMAYTMVRLNGDVAEIFEDWIRKTFPDRADKVLNKIKSCHGGTLSDNRFGTRMRGEGSIAEIINQQFKLAKKRYFQGRKMRPYNLNLHKRYKTSQLELF